MLREQTNGGFGLRRRSSWLLGIALLSVLLWPATPSADADFGFKQIGFAVVKEDGSAASGAGSHPYALTTGVYFNTVPGVEIPDEEVKDLRIELPPGLVGTPALTPRCSHPDFLDDACTSASVVGSIKPVTRIYKEVVPLYSLAPPSGVAAELGFLVGEIPMTIQITLNPDPPYNLIVTLPNIVQAEEFFGAELIVDGVIGESPFLTLPRSCGGSLVASFEADSWQEPGVWKMAPATASPGLGGCDALGFRPALTVQPTTSLAHGPSGLDLELDAPDPGLTAATGTAQADLAEAVLTLPEGMTVNAAVAEGLGGCSRGEYEQETLESEPGEGCPSDSKIGTATVESPLVEDPIEGSLFIAQPDDPATGQSGTENPFDSLLALYLVLEEPKVGLLVKQPIEVSPNPETGRLVATVDDLPQLPFSHLGLHFRVGARSPLVTPPGCGTHSTRFVLTPSSGASPLLGQSDFTADRNCAAAGFDPALSAGAVNPRAGTPSPFVLDLTRPDGDENVSAFTVTLPPGLSAEFGAVPPCPEPWVDSGECPVGSRVGSARIAAGTGAEVWIPQARRPGAPVYLGGPYRGAPFSLAIAVPVQAGPFDLGTTVVRAAVFVDPESAQARIDVDPLPQILDGIPIAYRTVRVLLDRPGFIHNPTSCAPMVVRAGVTSSTGTVAPASDRFQVGDCARLGFKPKVSVRLLGPTRRGAHPRLRTVVAPRAGDANIDRLSVTLPGTELLDSLHIRAVCTRPEFAAGNCPAGAIYGHAKAWTPLLDRPLEGPVYLRASKNRLPELALALEGQIDLDLTARLDSTRGRLRNTFEALPDTPLRKVVLTMAGGKNGLLVNGGGLCSRPQRVEIGFRAHSGKHRRAHPVVATDCRS